MSDSEPKWTFAHKFCADFNANVSELTTRLDALKSVVDASTPSATLQAITSDLSRLTRSLSGATGSLPSYDQRQCELQLKVLEKALEVLRGTSDNTPIFSFKRKTAKPKPTTERGSVVESHPKSQSTITDSAGALSAHTHRYLTILDVDTSAEVSISDLDNCIVNLLPSSEGHAKITALHLCRVTRSVVLLPQISSSIILHDLSRCVIAVRCHQFRMHNSAAVDVYIESGSDPIIENCSRIRFAAYPSSFVCEGPPQDGEHFTVKDFSHILSTPSPNWSSLPEGRWEKSWPILPIQDQSLKEELDRILSEDSQLA